MSCAYALFGGLDYAAVNLMAPVLSDVRASLFGFSVRAIDAVSA